MKNCRKNILGALVTLLLVGGHAEIALAANGCTARITSVNQTVEGTVGVTLNGSTSTPGNSDWTYSWSQTGGPPVILLGATTAQASFTAPAVGPEGAVLTFKLQQLNCSNTNGRDSTTTSITVSNAVAGNIAPVAQATVSPVPAQDGDTVTLDGSSSYDEDGTIASYAWTQLSGPAVSLTGANGAVASFVAPNSPTSDGQSLSFRLTVSDGSLTGQTDKIVNIVWANDPPVAALSCPTDVDEGEAVVLDGSASSDTEGSLTYEWFQLEGPPNVPAEVLTATPSIGFIAPQLGFQNLGFLPFRLVVSDGILQDSIECTVQIHDVTPPVISGATDLLLEATSAAGAMASYSPTYYDNVDGPNPEDPLAPLHYAVCVPESPHQFALGDHTVDCGADDWAGNQANASFTVTVVDTTAPVIAPHEDLEVEATKPEGADVAYLPPTTSDAVDGDGTAACLPPPGSTFALGANAVQCGAVDGVGNVATATSFQITVMDTTAPEVTPPADVEFEATGVLTPLGPADYGSATATDAVGVVEYENDAPASFPLGPTTIHWYARDAAGNSGSAVSVVTIVDTTAPVIAAHADVGPVEATGPAGAVVAYTLPGTSDAVDGPGFASCSPLSGSTFAIGSTSVTCIASDNAGNVATPVSFSVTVVDTTGPVIAPHADVTAVALSGSKAVVEYSTPTASDLVDGVRPVNCLPASGSEFNVGETVVTCSSSDTRGNTSTSTFKVIVSYAWTGFFSPVDNPAKVNSVKAGSGIPVKFSLGGDQGMAIMAAGYPRSVGMACGGALAEDQIEETVNAGGSSLSYGGGQYVYVWKSEKPWAGSCRQLQVKLADGSLHVANFSFK